MVGADRFHVSPARDTLYDALAVTESVGTRDVRRIANAIRRDPTTADDFLHDVCLAQAVLGDPALRAEYDQLLARVRATGQPLPKIGTAIEGERLGPGAVAQLGRSVQKGARIGGEALKVLFGIGFVIGVIALIAVGIGGRTNPYGSTYEPIKIPSITIPPPNIDWSKLYVPPPKLDLPKLDVPTVEMQTRDLPRVKVPKLDLRAIEVPAPPARKGPRTKRAPVTDAPTTPAPATTAPTTAERATSTQPPTPTRRPSKTPPTQEPAADAP